MSDKNWNIEALEDARECASNYEDEIAEQARDVEVSDDLLNDYPDGDSYHHENHVDHEYTLTDSAQILDQLADHEETDSGLWDGLEPRRAIACQAAYTYGNAVSYHWRIVVETINDVLADIDGEDRREAFARLAVRLLKLNADREPRSPLEARAWELLCDGSTDGIGIMADAMEDQGTDAREWRRLVELANTTEVEADA